MEDSTKIERKVEEIILKKWHLIVGIVGFFVTFVFPVIAFGFSIDKKQALIEQNIGTIQLNHESHMSTALQDIKEIKEEILELQRGLKIDHDAIIRLLQMHE